MSYKENVDYININLKRAATEDEIQVLNKFWDVISPKRYLKSSTRKIRKLFSKDMFFDKPLNSIEIKDYKININSYDADINSRAGEGLKKTLKSGIRADAVLLTSSIKELETIKELGQYYWASGCPVICTEIKENDYPKNIGVYSVSLVKKNKIKKQKVKNGLNIIVVGEPTSLNNEVKAKPFTHNKLEKLVDEAYENKIIKAVETCEYGIFTAIVKLIKRRRLGIFVNLDNLHKEEQGHSAFEYLNSQSPERLIFGVQNRKLVEFLKLVDKYELPFSIIGKIDKSKSIKVVNKNLQVIHLNKKLILNPIAKINIAFDDTSDNNYVFGDNITNDNLNKIIENDAFLSKKKYYKCFDGIIGNKTSFLSKENCMGELWYPEIKQFISYTLISDNLKLKYNPYVAGQNAVFEAYRRLFAFGHKPIGIYVNCNIDFSKPNSINKIKDLRAGVYFASKKLKLKILNLRITSSSEDAFSVVAIGTKKKREKLFVPYFENAQRIYIIGKPDNLPSTSYYQKILGSNIYPYPDEVNFKFEKRLLNCVKKLQDSNSISAIIPVEKFGIAGALIKALSPGKLGFKCYRKDLNLNYMFNEIQSRFLISTNQKIEHILKRYKIPYIEIGKTKTADFIEFNEQKVSCEEFYSKYFNV